jgi:hypothetical protein
MADWRIVTVFDILIEQIKRMNRNDLTREEYARVSVWGQTLREVLLLLKIAHRAEENSGFAMPDGARSLLDFRFPYPLKFENTLIAKHLRNAAIIYFGQLYKSGKGSAGVIEDNTSGRMKTLRTQMEASLFSRGIDRQQYENLTAQVKLVRDYALSHAAEPLINFEHTENGGASNTQLFSIHETIDIGFLYLVVYQMHELTHQWSIKSTAAHEP